MSYDIYPGCMPFKSDPQLLSSLRVNMTPDMLRAYGAARGGSKAHYNLDGSLKPQVFMPSPLTIAISRAIHTSAYAVTFFHGKFMRRKVV